MEHERGEEVERKRRKDGRRGRADKEGKGKTHTRLGHMKRKGR